MKVGRLSYLNGLPLFAGFDNGIACPAEFISSHPSHLNDQLSQGKLNISLISSFEFLKNRKKYALMPGFCIAAEGEVTSVNLYTKENFREIALTQESSSSAELVKLLCKHFWHLEPQFTPLPSIEDATNYDAFLLIGDQALRHPSFAGYKTIDLAAVWHEKTHLPMTFALFAARKETPQDHIDAFSRQLSESVRWGEENREAIYKIAHTSSRLPLKTLHGYYPRLTYRLGDAELAGLNTFGALCGLN